MILILRNRTIGRNVLFDNSVLLLLLRVSNNGTAVESKTILVMYHIELSSKLKIDYSR